MKRYPKKKHLRTDALEIFAPTYTRKRVTMFIAKSTIARGWALHTCSCSYRAEWVNNYHVEF